MQVQNSFPVTGLFQTQLFLTYAYVRSYICYKKIAPKYMLFVENTIFCRTAGYPESTYPIPLPLPWVESNNMEFFWAVPPKNCLFIHLVVQYFLVLCGILCQVYHIGRIYFPWCYLITTRLATVFSQSICDQNHSHNTISQLNIIYIT